MSLAALSVFAVEDTTAQITWRSLPRGPVTLEAGASIVTVEGTLTPGAVIIDGLTPDTDHLLVVTAAGRRLGTERFQTLPALDGPEL
ncbi:MAG: hypothetical protein ACR2H3_04825, partial [Acidimicrobiales bacterium]